MKTLSRILSVAGIGLLAGNVLAQTDTPYKVLDTTQLMGNGGIDYVYADNDGRRAYVPRGGSTFVFDLDSHKYIGSITNVGGIADDGTNKSLTVTPPLGSLFFR